MSLSGPFTDERYYPASLYEGWTALVHVVATGGLKLKSTDEFSMSVTFSAPPSGWTTGQNCSAQIVPSGDGIMVRVSGVAKSGSQVDNNRRLKKLTDALLADVGGCIQHMRRAARG